MAAEFQRSIGLELGGSRNDRTALATLDFFPKTNRLILAEVDSGHQTGEKELPHDEALVDNMQTLRRQASHFTGIGVHAPTSLPPYFREAAKKWPFPDKTRHAEVLWMNRTWEKTRPRPKPFLPYLQRPAEIWLRYFTPEKYPVPDGMGANCAPLAARFQFLAPHLPGPFNEVYPRATITRLVSALGLSKNITRLYTDLEKGVTFREDFLNGLSRKLPQVFIYDRDLEMMILHLNCFHAFAAALTQHLAHMEQTEPRPRGYPKHATWIHIPRAEPDWNRVFGG